jgi:AraC family transcriptional regulator
VTHRSIGELRAREFDDEESSARVELQNDISAYIDRPNSLLFLEEGIVRFEATNVVVHTRGQDHAYKEHIGPLSITFTHGGRNVTMVDGRRMAVDEDSYLVSNLGQHVVGTADCDPGAETFVVGFWPGFAEEILRTLVTPADRMLDNVKLARFQPLEFYPQLYRHDEIVSPVLEQLRCAIYCGGMTRGWLEEWNHRLLLSLLRVHRRVTRDIEDLPGARPATRAEYYERLSRARDFMESHLEAPLDLRGISAEAFLSPHHFLRLFKQVYKETPHQYLTRRRIERAQRLLLRADLPVTDVCYAVGFESLGSFSWLFRKRVGLSPDQYRKENRLPRPAR